MEEATQNIAHAQCILDLEGKVQGLGSRGSIWLSSGASQAWSPFLHLLQHFGCPVHKPDSGCLQGPGACTGRPHQRGVCKPGVTFRVWRVGFRAMPLTVSTPTISSIIAAILDLPSNGVPTCLHTQSHLQG